MQTDALVDSGATLSFVNKTFVDRNHLVTHKMPVPYTVYNADGTLNKYGSITHAIRAYIEIGSHKTNIILPVANLGTKDMFIGYNFLHSHNPSIDWRSGEWEFTRCPETCTNKDRRKKQPWSETDMLEEEKLTELDLDYEGVQDPISPYINWVSDTAPG